MRLTLSQQIALSLRNRPLVLPMLLATVCVDLLLARNVATPGSGVSSHMIFNFCLLGQVGLLAFWSSCRAAWWWLRVLVSLALILLFAIDPASTAIRWDSFATHSVYFAVVLGMRSLGSLIAYTRGENPQAIRFGVRHLLIAMTLLAVGSTMARFVVPRDWSTTADDAAFVVTLLAVVTAMPFPLKAIVDRTRRFTRSNALALIYCALTGGATGLALARAFMHGSNSEWFIQALTLMSVGYGLWFIASSVPPDARRRLASRRHRRRAPMPMLRVVAPPDEPNEPAADNTPRIGFDAKG